MNSTAIKDTIDKLNQHSIDELRYVIAFAMAAVETKKREQGVQNGKSASPPTLVPVNNKSYAEVLKRPTPKPAKGQEVRQASDEFEKAQKFMHSPHELSEEEDEFYVKNFCDEKCGKCIYKPSDEDDPAIEDHSLIRQNALFLDGFPQLLNFENIRKEIFRIIDKQVYIESTHVPVTKCAHNKGKKDESGKYLQCQEAVSARGDFCEEHGGPPCDYKNTGNQGIAFMTFDSHKDAVQAYKILKKASDRRKVFGQSIGINFSNKR